MHNLQKPIVGTLVQGWTKIPVWLPDYKASSQLGEVTVRGLGYSPTYSLKKSRWPASNQLGV